jgi:hypothetical protein
MPSSPVDLHGELCDIPSPTVLPASSTTVSNGQRFQPQQQILLYSSDDWEGFIQEWAHSLKAQYTQVARLTGSGDRGIDIAGLADDKGLKGVWDCFQCKHYGHPLTPTTAYPEIGKILWFSFQRYYAAPRRYYFVAPRGCGPKLQNLLLDSEALKDSLIAGWDKYCKDEITDKTSIELAGKFLDYVSAFDFAIFSAKTSLEIIDAHRDTPYFVTRFGGGLPIRPASPTPPTTIAAGESEYVRRLFEIYSEECGEEVQSSDRLLELDNDLLGHLDRQRESFYSAEALRNFARDAVPEGTFEDLQAEVYTGVIDIAQLNHPSSMARLTCVTETASKLALTANGLISVTRIQDRKGICHQLANEKRIRWRKT